MFPVKEGGIQVLVVLAPFTERVVSLLINHWLAKPAGKVAKSEINNTNNLAIFSTIKNDVC